jgi:hypothetical protein
MKIRCSNKAAAEDGSKIKFGLIFINENESDVYLFIFFSIVSNKNFAFSVPCK